MAENTTPVGPFRVAVEDRETAREAAAHYRLPIAGVERRWYAAGAAQERQRLQGTVREALRMAIEQAIDRAGTAPSETTITIVYRGAADATLEVNGAAVEPLAPTSLDVDEFMLRPVVFTGGRETLPLAALAVQAIDDLGKNRGTALVGVVPYVDGAEQRVTRRLHGLEAQWFSDIATVLPPSLPR